MSKCGKLTLETLVTKARTEPVLGHMGSPYSDAGLVVDRERNVCGNPSCRYRGPEKRESDG